MQPSYDTTLQLFSSNLTFSNYDLWWMDRREDGQTDRQTCLTTCSYCQAKGLMGGCYLWRPPIVFPAGPPFPLGWACTRSYTHKHTCPHFGRTHTDPATLSETGGCSTASPNRQADDGCLPQPPPHTCFLFFSLHLCNPFFSLKTPNGPPEKCSAHPTHAHTEHQ